MASVWGELKRRNVVKVAVAYAIVGWLLIEVTSTVFPLVQLPDWTATFVAMLILVGFPIALILSWAYEITPEGMKRSHEVPAHESIARITGRKLDFAIIGALVLALGFVVYNYVLVDDDVAGVLPNSVAVIPFDNMSADPEEAYFAAGMHDEIINHLAKLKSLNVIARTSVMQYAGVARPITEIARELNVGTIMEGSVSYAEGRVAIRAQLIDAETGVHLWSDSYNREFFDVFAIQADIAMNIANAIGAEFSLEEQESIEKIPTNSPEAYRLYLLARQTGGALGSEYLDQAIEADPNFAQAYLRRANRNLNLLRFDRRQENFAIRGADLESRVLQDVDRALMLNPNLGDAYSILGLMHSFNWRGTEAREAYERAYELSPNDTSVLVGYALFFLSWAGQHEQAIEVAQRAVQLDPATGRSNLGEIFEFAKDKDNAYAAYKEAFEQNPNSPRLLPHLGLLEIVFGNRVEAEQTLRLAELVVGDNPVFLPQVIYGYGRLQLHEDVERLAAHLERLADDQRVATGNRALVSLARGDHDEALSLLESAAQGREPYEAPVAMMRIKMNVFEDPILDQPRFVAVRERLGFTDL